jgi:hypothetical protein
MPHRADPGRPSPSKRHPRVEYTVTGRCTYRLLPGNEPIYKRHLEREPSSNAPSPARPVARAQKGGKSSPNPKSPRKKRTDSLPHLLESPSHKSTGFSSARRRFSSADLLAVCSTGGFRDFPQVILAWFGRAYAFCRPRCQNRSIVSLDSVVPVREFGARVRGDLGLPRLPGIAAAPLPQSQIDSRLTCAV